MDLVRLKIPLQFLRARVHVRWRDILFGLDEGLLDPAVPVQFATDAVAMLDAPAASVLELAALLENEPTRRHVELLASTEPVDEDDVRKKWLYVVLAWVLEHKTDYSDPFEIVAMVYADFGYPPEISGLVRYMPSTEPDLGTRARNEERLYLKWQAYLSECASRFHG